MRSFKKELSFAIGTLTFLTPMVAFAALEQITTLIVSVVGIVNILIPLAMALAVLAFFWGLVVYIFQSGDDAKRKKGVGLMGWGIAALFVMVAVWGLIQFIAGNLGIGTGGTVIPPTVQTI